MNDKIGRFATDRITGFSGIVTGRCEYITGCNQLLIAPSVKSDGTFMESHWFDEQRVEMGTTDPMIILDNGTSPGPDKPAPKR